ncbi:MAG: hypothetical protein ABIJ56_13125 [Pseudomonadota bacterium]
MNIRALPILLPVFLAAQGCYASGGMSYEPGAQDAHQDADRPDNALDADIADVTDAAGDDVLHD